MYREMYFSILRHVTAHHSARALLTFLLLLTSSAFADDEILNHFTNSITTIYISSTQECENTLAPGPTEYKKLITDYLNIFYPGGISYWVLPEVSQRVNDRTACIIAIQAHLTDYQAARRDYSH